MLADHLGKDITEVGSVTFRQPYAPVTFGAIAGGEVGEMLDPVRKTAIHPWHVAHGALFENVGSVEEAVVLPEARGVDAGYVEPGMPSRSECRGYIGPVYPGKDRRSGAGCGGVPEPNVFQQLAQARGGSGAIRV